MANLGNEWIKVVVHPLGFAGYALFLVFGLLARAKRKNERRWILPAALAAAGIALLGGISLSYFQVRHENNVKDTGSPLPSAVPSSVDTSTSTTGTSSPIVQGNQGSSVSINYSASPQPEKKQTSKNPKPNRDKGQ